MACRLVASGTEDNVEAEVEPVSRHVEDYADHKCYYVNVTMAILPRQGAEQPALGGARRRPTIDVVKFPGICIDSVRIRQASLLASYPFSRTGVEPRKDRADARRE